MTVTYNARGRRSVAGRFSCGVGMWIKSHQLAEKPVAIDMMAVSLTEQRFPIRSQIELATVKFDLGH